MPVAIAESAHLPITSSTGHLPVGVALHSQAALQLLDAPQEWGAFSRPCVQQADCWESSVVIEGMHCAACSLTVEEALLRVPGVVSAQVGAASHRASVVWSAQLVLPSTWMHAVQASGYRAVPANDLFANERRKLETRKALWRWLVAGLCMMQVMMYAYPAYVARTGDLTAEMEQLLRWASWVLTLPVMLFSCGPFFQSAARDWVHRRISMDLPVALGIFITFAVSTIGTFEPHGTFGREVYFDSLTMFVFFLLTGRWLELRLRDRTAGALEALMNRLPDGVERLMPDGAFERVAVRRLVLGDVICVRPGETFCADGVVEQGDTTVDESLLTGESHPLSRRAGDPVLCGSHNLSGTVRVNVCQLGEATRFAQIAALMESASASKPHSAQIADRLAKPFLIAVLVAAGGAAAWWWDTNPGHALMVAVAVLVVTCPCALSLATPAAMLAAAGTMARSGVLVRRLGALESLAEVDTFVFDKTGTLTHDAMVVGAIHARQGCGKDRALAMAAALARHSLHPASRALVLAAQSGSQDGGFWHCDEATETAGGGVSGVARGAQLDSHVGPCNLSLGSADFCGVLRPIEAGSPCVEGPEVFLSDAQGWLATFQLKEDLRPQAQLAVAALQADGLTVHLLSGDHPQAVARLALQLGVDHARGGCSPDGKLAYLRHLQSEGRKVAMVGDGMNDGPVLAGANVSFALGRAVPLAQARADFVLLGDRLLSAVDARRLSCRTLRVVRQNLWWALGYNAACVPLAVMGYMPAWLAGLGMASSSLLVVLNALRLTRDVSVTEE